MSDTPRTAKAKIACGFQAVPQSFLEHAENLERENDKLWKANHRHQSTLHDLRSTLEVLPLESSVQTAQRLKRENAALRERLEQLQDFAVLVLRGLDSGYIRSKPFIDTSDDNATEYPVRTLEEIARAALARKEVQP